MPHLLNIPLEVLLQITSYLTTPEYGYLRETCKQLEALLFRAFAREFFSKRQFALMEFSIQALVDIAKSRFGPTLTHLIIHLEHPYAAQRRSQRPPISLHASVHTNHTLYLEEYLNHVEFVTTGLDAEILSEAIKHLPNLETIGMRDFRSGSRHRDNTVWNSYGCPTFVAKTGCGLELPVTGTRDRGHEYISHVFLTILRAIGTAAHSRAPIPFCLLARSDVSVAFR
ncbi:hypothetical protein ONZ43_g5964 [Nemania bipapillata]|uniref:Uncharacterized protein n=1 Tax=Nemania bipapillata TaxID=110536 RepID=A0ACC2I4B3_9PEZI|nr:hypothetical protein ONZ43_g5964 [Nemania bipapillata]